MLVQEASMVPNIIKTQKRIRSGERHVESKFELSFPTHWLS